MHDRVNTVGLPFTATHHRKKDNLPASLIVDNGETAVYRVEFKDISRLTSTSSTRFKENFNG